MTEPTKRGRGRPRKERPVEVAPEPQPVEAAPTPEPEDNREAILTRFEIEKSRSVHKDRVPIHRHRDILTTYNIPEGFTGRWVKDLPGRVEKFLQAGWSMLTQRGIRVGERGLGTDKEVGDVITRHAGPNDGYTLYLMVIERELYDADQAEKQALVDEVDRAMEAEIQKDGQYGDVRSRITY